MAVIDNVAYHYRQREDSMFKLNVGYSAEVQKLKYLYDYLLKWDEKMPDELELKIGSGLFPFYRNYEVGWKTTER